MEICQLKVYIQKDSCVIAFIDKMAEWLRQLTVNPMGSTCVGSNPIFVVFLIGSMVKWIAICSLNSAIQVLSSEKKLVSWKPQPAPSSKFRKKQNIWRKNYRQCNVLDG